MNNPPYACFFPDVHGGLVGLVLDAETSGVRVIHVANQDEADDYCKQAGITPASPDFLDKIARYRQDNYSWKRLSSWRIYHQGDYLLRIYWHEADWLMHRLALLQDDITAIRTALAAAPEKTHERLVEIPGRTLLLRARREDGEDNVNLSAIEPDWPSDIRT